MKITGIETHVCHARMRNWIFIKVLTDQPGLHGWGEATLEWHTRAVVGAIDDLAQLILGEDPARIEHLWQMMYRQHFWHGNGIVRGTAGLDRPPPIRRHARGSLVRPRRLSVVGLRKRRRRSHPRGPPRHRGPCRLA